MFDSLWTDNIWSHEDQFTSPESPRHQFFDPTWNMGRQTEDIRKRHKVAKRQLNRAKQKFSRSQKQFGLSSNAKQHPTLHVNGELFAHNNDDPSNTKGKHVSLRQPRAQVSEGAPSRKQKPTSSTSATLLPPSSRKRKLHAQRRGLCQAKLNFQPKLTPEDDKDISSPCPSVANVEHSSPSPSQDGADENFPGDNMLDIVSQLCSSEHCPPSFVNGTNDSTQIDAMPSVERGITDLSFLDDHIPFALAAGSATNPDTLSQRDMLKAHDKDEFIKCQPDEINGLHEANVFDHMKLDDIPPSRRRKLLNAIWSHCQKQ